MSTAKRFNERINKSIKGGRKKFSLISVVIIVAVVITVPVSIIFAASLFNSSNNNSSQNNIVTEDNVNDIIEDMENNPSDGKDYGSYETIMSLDWTFDNGSAISDNAYVANAKSNPGIVYFTITTVDNPDEELYHSPYIDLGSELSEIKLDKSLPAGRYECLCTYHLVDDEYVEQSQVTVSITITIKN